MKYVCMGYIEPGKWESFSETERNSFMDECFAYDEELQRGGHIAGGFALQGPDSAVTVRWGDSQAMITDGPYAETKEQIGGILILEARDLNHAIQLMSRHPGVRLGGPFEIRPTADLDAMLAGSVARRQVAK